MVHCMQRYLKKLVKNNKSGCIVTLVNSIDDYGKWENICGKGRILPAFPGAGGSIKEDVLDADLTPRVVQPTTFAEISGKITDRVKKTLLAMVVPIADAYYEAEFPQMAGKELKVMVKTAKRLKRNFHFLKGHIGKLSPNKMYLFLFIPMPILTMVLSLVFRSSFGDRFMYQHSVKAPDEMRQLHNQFYTYVKTDWQVMMNICLRILKAQTNFTNSLLHNCR